MPSAAPTSFLYLFLCCAYLFLCCSYLFLCCAYLFHGRAYLATSTFAVGAMAVQICAVEGGQQFLSSFKLAEAAPAAAGPATAAAYGSHHVSHPDDIKAGRIHVRLFNATVRRVPPHLGRYEGSAPTTHARLEESKKVGRVVVWG